MVLNFSEKSLQLDFSRAKEINGQNLRILFSSAERQLTTKSPRGLAISPFEVLIAEVVK